MASTKRAPLRSRLRKPILILVLIAMLVNLGLAFYIQAEKEHNFTIIPEYLRGNCFDGAEGGANCGAVQTSVYADTLGVSNPYYGYVGFALAAILLGALLYADKKKKTAWIAQLAPLLLVGLVAGSLFSLWLLYAQFFLIGHTCIYCLTVDGLMLASTIAFAWVAWRDIF